ncbi:DUF4398 domain-containing protein [Pseudomonas abieticivorans]|uniref:DUF4398 domain-containing protein n=1 Tax=Pseudomonas abieticivorans TaxID=2931382 RepID=UPI0020BE91BB|nr:DUF4398 domain-containing protein [Pseudomonas sp. PIA16]
MRIQPLFVAVAVLALAGCANDPAPTQQLRLTEQAVDQAKAVGATDEVPSMKLANDKLATALADAGNQSNRAARMQAEQAELDARLAEAQVLTQKSKEQQSVLDARIVRLRKQLGGVQ